MITRLARGGVWVLAASAALVFVYLGIRRLFYPLELDYIEGVMMDHVVRLARGEAIYVAPTLEFIPLAYMPGFATIASLLAMVFGPQFWQVRLVSLVSMLLLAVVVMRIVFTETRSWTVGAAGAGVLLMAYGVTGGHYDVGRPDSLMLLLAFSGLAMLRFTQDWLGAIAAAALMTLAFFTKQHAVMFIFAAFAHLLTSDRRRLLPFGLTVTAGCVGGYLMLSHWLGPWFSYFTWDVPSHWSSISKVRLLNYAGRGLMGTLGALTVPALLCLALPDHPWRGRPAIWLWAAMGSIATGFMATLDPDAFRHVLNPTVVGFSILGPISVMRIIHHLAAWPGSDRPGRSLVVYLLLALQFLPLAYPIRSQLPRPRADNAHALLIDRLRAYPGGVIVLYHGFYGWSAGKGTSLHQITLDDIVRSRGNRLLAKDPQYFERMFEKLRTGSQRPMIVTDTELHLSGSESRELWASIAGHYRLVGELGWISDALNPVNGNHWTPKMVYVPVEDGATELPAGFLLPDSSSVQAPVAPPEDTSSVRSGRIAAR